MSHKCPKDNCGIDMPDHLLACRPHWYSIPMHIRNDVNRTWKQLTKASQTGQSSIEGAQREYMAARKAAIECLNGVI